MFWILPSTLLPLTKLKPRLVVACLTAAYLFNKAVTLPVKSVDNFCKISAYATKEEAY